MDVTASLLQGLSSPSSAVGSRNACKRWRFARLTWKPSASVRQMSPRTRDRNHLNDGTRKGCFIQINRVYSSFFSPPSSAFPGLLLTPAAVEWPTMCWTESEEQLFQMSWRAGIRDYLAYFFLNLTFNRAALRFDYVFPSSDTLGRGSAAGKDAGAATEEMVYKSQSHVA